jgi:hypothetical protein
MTPVCDPTESTVRSSRSGPLHGIESVRTAGPNLRPTPDDGPGHRTDRGPDESNCEGD